MNNKILNSFLTACVAISLASCGENTWNDHYLDGFEGGADYNTPSSTEGKYTLTSDDYAAISKLLQGQATTETETAAAKAIATNKYFDKTGIYPAPVALPYLMATMSFPYYLDANGSNVAVTYNEADAVPAEITAISGARTYKVSDANYQQVWGSDDNYIASFAPAHTASAALPAILKEAFNAAVEGEYAVVSYNEAQTNPVFGGVSDAPVVYINQTFADGIDNFTLDNVKLPEGSTYIWKATEYQGSFYMKASAFVNKACRESEGWLISPEIKLGAEANAVLSYEQAWKNFASLDDAKNEATCHVREKGGAWVKLNPVNLPLNTNYDFINTGNIDLSAYNGKTIQIGFCYKSSTKSAGTWQVNNILLQDGALATVRSRAAAADVPSEAKNAVYYFNGTKWAPAEGVSVLNPADYTAMGFNNNSLTDADVYVPMYLKNKLPYAQNGDMEYVVYNGNKCDLFVFDGSSWTLNNNGLETVTARYTRKATGWTFVKYLGKAVFNIFNEAELILDRNYLVVCNDQSASPIPSGKNYGYPSAVNVPIVDGTITLDTDNNAFTFASSYTNEETGVTTKTPEGTFLFQQSDGRYFYLSGGYNSPNLTDAPLINNGQIDETYLFTAKNNGDGTWSIVRGDRTMHLSTNFGSFGFYQPSGTSELEILPSLYLLD